MILCTYRVDVHIDIMPLTTLIMTDEYVDNEVIRSHIITFVDCHFSILSTIYLFPCLFLTSLMSKQNYMHEFTGHRMVE